MTPYLLSAFRTSTATRWSNWRFIFLSGVALWMLLAPAAFRQSFIKAFIDALDQKGRHLAATGDHLFLVRERRDQLRHPGYHKPDNRRRAEHEARIRHIIKRCFL